MRRLVAAYTLKSATFVWRCDQCLKMFIVRAEEAQVEGVPPHILVEFRAHACISPPIEQATPFELNELEISDMLRHAARDEETDRS